MSTKLTPKEIDEQLKKEALKKLEKRNNNKDKEVKK